MISSNGRRYESYDFVEGVASVINRRYFETNSDDARRYYSRYMASRNCTVCEGSRLNKTALAIKIGKKSI